MHFEAMRTRLEASLGAPMPACWDCPAVADICHDEADCCMHFSSQLTPASCSVCAWPCTHARLLRQCEVNQPLSNPLAGPMSSDTVMWILHQQCTHPCITSGMFRSLSSHSWPCCACWHYNKARGPAGRKVSVHHHAQCTRIMHSQLPLRARDHSAETSRFQVPSAGRHWEMLPAL